MTITKIKKDKTAEIDLGNSPTMTISSDLGVAEVYVDYEKKPGEFVSAIKGNAGYKSPFSLRNGEPKVVFKKDLESEHLRVGAQNNDITVSYETI
ncbi:hypothetical protein [uncultured Aquimarina sp.]|uniref:hypothetical protein n=1 Tax=uncultured Aquimarina sp. TaxID=575652 RepID=UPI00261D3083|nr:hypothetical protein [uncultured Aquimarina sp.]